MLRVDIVTVLGRHVGKIIAKRYRKTFVFLPHVRDLRNLDLQKLVRGHNRWNLPNEHIVVHFGEVGETFHDRQVIVLFEEFD